MIAIDYVLWYYEIVGATYTKHPTQFSFKEVTMYEIKYGTKTIVILYNGKVIAASSNIFELLLKLRKYAASIS